MPAKIGEFEVTFAPAGQDHAISEVVFSAVFENAFDPAELKALDAAYPGIQQLLPSKKPVNSLRLQVGPDGIPNQVSQGLPPVSGFNFERFTPAGTLDTRLMVNDNQVIVNWLQYSRWEEAYLYGARLLEFAGRVLDKADTGLRVISFEVVDQFYHNPDSEYALSELLDPQSPYAPAFMFEVGKLWHVHTGWFEAVPIGVGRTLNLLNIEGVEFASNSGERKEGVKIHHIQQIQLDPPLKGRLLEKVAAKGELRQAFDALHMQNKVVLRNCITKSMADRIKLNV